MKACVFVDGENFRYSIINLFNDFRREDYLPKSADWAGLFDWIVNDAVPDGERVRTYWYVTQSLDFFPFKFPNPESETDALRRLLSKHKPYKDELRNMEAIARIRRMEEIVQELRDRQAMMQNRFDGWRRIQAGIEARHNAVEFRRAGSIQYDLYKGTLGREKAVDVKLATDMIVLKDIYAAAIILSGDQDYVPAVQVLKDFGKRVINIAFTTRNGKLLPGGARRLNQMADRSVTITHDSLASFLKI